MTPEQTLFPVPEESGPFERFWKAWPRHFRKRSRKIPLARWKRENLDSQIEHVLAVLEIDKKRWAKSNNEYVPAPEVWINKRMWDCEIEDIAPKRSTVAHPLVKQIAKSCDVRGDPEKQTANNIADRVNGGKLMSKHNKAQRRKVQRWAIRQVGKDTASPKATKDLREFIAYRILAKWIREHRSDNPRQ